MQKYIGTKLIQARPMSRQAYNDYRGWELPDDEDGADEGYLVEYLDGGQANHPGHEGYISWSPAGVFERAYRPCAGMTFGQAKEALKAGQRVCRAGWNGKGMFLFMVAGGAWGFETDVDGVDGLDTLPFVAIKTADEKLVPWLCSQTDALAEDWEVLE
ncbi:MAG: hypothetical protein CME38_01355 [Haliea sp.]|nr:hypothetical protein [Haliea sp.]